ncbi:MAG TPA: histidine phosphatase family protein [Bacteroidales bacterium]|nr:histidine phosphatase family protein [Bacteroidales bacterium]
MKTLYILRHAKSSWNYPGLPDDQRPLLEKGIKRTGKVATYMSSHNMMPDIIISSTAVRAAETAKLIAVGIQFPVNEIQYSHSLYLCDPEKIFDQLYPLDDIFKSAMIVGHNPTLTNFVNQYLPKPLEWLPTSGLAIIDFKTDKWTELANCSTGRSVVFSPKEL